MNLAGTTYSINDRAFDIFLAGCKGPHCPGCHNPYTWDFDAGEPLDITELIQKILDNEEVIDRIRIMGGEPLDQPINELVDLLSSLSATFPSMEIWLFTGYLPSDLNRQQDEVYRYADYVKFGRYNSAYPPAKDPLTGLLLGSCNQFVYRANLRAPGENP